MAHNLRLADRHNSVLPAALDNAYFEGILTFLRQRSPLRHLLTIHNVVSITYLRQFWDSAQYIEDQQCIRAFVNGQQLEFTAADLANIM